MKIGIWGITFSLAASLLAFPAVADEGVTPAPAAQAGSQPHKGKGRHHEEMKQVFEACAKAGGLPAPEPGTKPNLSAGDKAAMHACMQRFHDDVKSCLSEAGIQPPAPGQPHGKPSAADQAAFKTCHQKALGMISSN